MDISQIGIAIAMMSVSIAVLKLNGNNKKNSDYVKRPECHRSMDNLKEHISERFEDLKDFITKNGKF